MKDIAISTDKTPYIQLGQFLKLAGCASTGGHAKIMLTEEAVRVNGEVDTRRGRKLYPNDTVDIDGCGSFRVIQEA